MNHLKRPRRPRVALPGLGSAVALLTLVGCQSYERVPVDLADHRAAFDTRLDTTEPISRFVDRLAEQGHAVPDRFDPSDGLSVAEGEVLAALLQRRPPDRSARRGCGGSRRSKQPGCGRTRSSASTGRRSCLPPGLSNTG